LHRIRNSVQIVTKKLQICKNTPRAVTLLKAKCHGEQALELHSAG
jgi:hypothetical protein